jgi:hypothetical protein
MGDRIMEEVEVELCVVISNKSPLPASYYSVPHYSVSLPPFASPRLRAVATLR